MLSFQNNLQKVANFLSTQRNRMQVNLFMFVFSGVINKNKNDKSCQIFHIKFCKNQIKGFYIETTIKVDTSKIKNVESSLGFFSYFKGKTE